MNSRILTTGWLSFFLERILKKIMVSYIITLVYQAWLTLGLYRKS